MKKFRLTRDVTNKECHWLKKQDEVAKGDIVYEYTGCTYGYIGSGIAVSKEKGKPPFFELPRDALAEVDG